MKQVFYLKPLGEPLLGETSEPLIIWTISLGADVLAMPELIQLINVFYFEN